jgi:signal transduction histidine kinase
MADASHELRTPVSIMRTAADVTLSQTGRDEAEYRDALGVVAEQTTRLARLVDDMLVLARADAGGYPIVRSEVDLDGIVLDSIRDFAAKAAAKRITLSSQVRPVSAVADEALLRRLVGNLLSNAIAYTPEGGTVDVAIVEERGATSIRVSDSGPGIPAEDRERVFERFVRLDPARGEGGAGLGLAIARWIAEVHGGQVELLRSDARGSVFAATIPASA